MKNKIFISLFLSIMLLLIISACTSDNSFEQSKTENSVSQWHHAVMSLNISKENFDAKGSASTRATSDEWQDGDKLYLRFVTYNGIVLGNATYDGSKGMWNVDYNGTLNKNKESKLFVVFLDNVENENPAQDGVIPLDCYHGVYMDENGTYIFNSQNELKVKASLKTLTSRVRIKGEAPDEKFKLIGLSFYKGYNTNTHEFTLSGDTAVVRTSTDKNKESRYIYVKSLVESNRQIMIGRTYEEGNYIFKAICSKDMFVVGKSGFITMPNKTQHNGWSIKQVSGKDENGYGWVDLDLPSGTIWATENFGANLAEWQNSGDSKYMWGNQCMWGSVDYTNWSKATTDIGGTSEDIVTQAWGDKWRTPGAENYREIGEIDWGRKVNVKDIWNDFDYYINGSSYMVQGTKIIGKNDEVLFLVNNDGGSRGEYWTSTPRSETEAYYACLVWGLGCDVRTGPKTMTFSIRPIMKK